MIFFHLKIFMTFFTLRILGCAQKTILLMLRNFFKQHSVFLFIHLLSFKIKSLTMKIKVYNIFWFYCNCSFAFFLILFYVTILHIIFFYQLYYIVTCDIWLIVISLLISDNVDTHKFMFVGALPVTDYSFVWFYLWSCNFIYFSFLFQLDLNLFCCSVWISFYLELIFFVCYLKSNFLWFLEELTFWNESEWN